MDKFRAHRKGCRWNGIVQGSEAAAWDVCTHSGEDPQQGEVVTIERVRPARLRDFIGPADVIGVIVERMAAARIDDSVITSEVAAESVEKELDAALGSALDDVQQVLDITVEGYTVESTTRYTYPERPL